MSSGRELTDHKLAEIPTLAAGSVTTSDYFVIHDVSADAPKRVLVANATLLAATQAANVAANASTASTLTTTPSTLTTTPADEIVAEDATTLTTAMALCNTTKVSVNALITENAAFKTSIGALITENAAFKTSISALIVQNATFKTSINAEIAAIKAAGLQATA